MTPGENKKLYFFADRLLYPPRIDLDALTKKLVRFYRYIVVL